MLGKLTSEVVLGGEKEKKKRFKHNFVNFYFCKALPSVYIFTENVHFFEITINRTRSSIIFVSNDL